MERLEMERLGLGVIDKVVNTATNVYDYAAHGIPPDISTISNDIIEDVIEMQHTIKTDLSSRNYHILFAKFDELTKKFQRLHSALESKQSTLPPAPNSQPPQVHPQTPQQYAQHPTYASPQQPHPYDYPQPVGSEPVVESTTGSPLLTSFEAAVNTAGLAMVTVAKNGSVGRQTSGVGYGM